MNKPQLPTRTDTRLSLPIALLAAAAIAVPLFAQEPVSSPKGVALPADSPVTGTKESAATTSSSTTTASSPAAASGGQPSEAEMMKMMMDMAKLNDNHKLLGQLAGTWDFTTKFWMDPSKPPQESKGTATRKPMMDGRFYVLDVSGKFPMPGPDGKMKEMDFKGFSVEGYDNAKQKFVGTWCDNMGTGIMTSEGTYDAGTKTFTYRAEYMMAPGMTQQFREVVKIVDNNHHNFEMFENRGGQEVKTMEINYTRKK